MMNSVNRMYLASSSETRPPYFAKNRGVAYGSTAKTTMLDDDEHERPEREGREDQAQGDDGAEVVDEARGEDRLAEFGPIESKLEHHGVDDGDRRRRQRDAGEPARSKIPAKQKSSDERRANERTEEADQSDDRRLAPLAPEHLRVQLGARQERQQDRAGAGKETSPIRSCRRASRGRSRRRRSAARPCRRRSPRAPSRSFSQIASSVAMSARPTQSDARNHTFSMTVPSFLSTGVGWRRTGRHSPSRSP